MKKEIVPEFVIKFSKDSVHYVTLFVHPTIKQLRSLGRYKHENSVRDAEAFFWTDESAHPDGFVGEIHVARDNITVAFVAHEAAHASYQRNLFIGRAPEIAEEFFCEDVGILTDAIVAHLTTLGVTIKSGQSLCHTKKRS